MFISVVEDCEYIFVWFMVIVCFVQNNEYDDCQVINLSIGYLFDLIFLSGRVGFIVVYSEKGLVYMSICGENENCFFGVGVCFGQIRISVGKVSKRLRYVDQVLQLVYKDGFFCFFKFGLSYKSVISFVCRFEVGLINRFMFIFLDKQMCIFFFFWYMLLVCE